MSAIGLLPRPQGKIIISSHADYRREDFVFARTQSVSSRNLPWDHSTPPLRSWDRIVYWSAGAITALCISLGLLR